MASPSEVKKDAVFQQAQEIFTQMEPEVIYMVLSEMDFNLDAAMESLIMLSQASEQDEGFKIAEDPTFANEGRDSQSAIQVKDVNSAKNLDVSPQCPIYRSYYGQHNSPNDMLEDVPLKTMYTDFTNNEPSLASKDMFETMPPRMSENPWSLTNFNALSAYSTNESSAAENSSKSEENIIKFDNMLLDMNSLEQHEQIPLSRPFSKKLTEELHRRERYGTTSAASEKKAPGVTGQDGYSCTYEENKLTHIVTKDKHMLSEEGSNVLQYIKEPSDSADEKVMNAGMNESSKYLEDLVDDLSEDREDADSVIEDIDISETAKKLVISVLSYTGIGALNGVKMTFCGNGKMQPSSVLGMHPSPDPAKLFSKFKQEPKASFLNEPVVMMSGKESSKEDAVSLKESFDKIRVAELEPASNDPGNSKLSESKHSDDSKNGEDAVISPTVATQLKRLDTLIDESLKENQKREKSQREQKSLELERNNKSHILDLHESESGKRSLEENNNITSKTSESVGTLKDFTFGLDTAQAKEADISKCKSESSVVAKRMPNDNVKPAPNQWSFVDPPSLRRMNDVAMSPGLRLPNHSRGSQGGIRMPVHGGVPVYSQNRMYFQQPVYCNVPPGFYQMPPINPYNTESYFTPRMPHPVILHQQSVMRPPPPQASEIKKSQSAMIVSSTPQPDAKVKKSQSQSAVHTAPRPNLIANGIAKPPQKIMYILRGLPGSGKSTLARKLAGKSGRVSSTDDFFITKSGRYEFDINFIGEAHEWNKNRVKKFVQEGMSPVVVDNTNMTAWEMKPYAEIAVRHCYRVQIKEPDTPWKNKARICAQKNSHGVPLQTIKNMRLKYEPDITVEKLLMSTKVVDGSQPLPEKKSYQLSRPMHSMTIPNPKPSNVDFNKSDKLHVQKQTNVTVSSTATQALRPAWKNLQTAEKVQGCKPKQNVLNQSKNAFVPNQLIGNGKKVLDCYGSPSSNSDIPLSCSTPVFTVHCSPKDSLVPSLTDGKATSTSGGIPLKAKGKDAHSDKVIEMTSLRGKKAMSVDTAFAPGSRRESRSVHHPKKNHLGFNERPRPKSLSPRGRNKAKSLVAEHRFPFKKTVEDKQSLKQPGNKQSIIKSHTENGNAQSNRIRQKLNKTASEKKTEQEHKKEVVIQDNNLQSKCSSQSERFDPKGKKDSGLSSLDASTVINQLSSAKEVPLSRPKTEEHDGTSSLGHMERKHVDIAARSIADESKLVNLCKEKALAYKDPAGKVGARRTKLAAVFQTQPLLPEESKKKIVSCNDWGALSPVRTGSSSVNLVDENSNAAENNTNIHRNSFLEERVIREEDKSSQTEMNDLVFANKASSCKTELPDGMFVLSGRGDQFVPKSDRGSTNDHFPNQTVLKFDKSSSTKEMEEDLQKKEEQITHDLDTLKLLFDDLPADKLHEVYKDCNRDLEWTSNILAESSMFGDASFTSKTSDSKPFIDEEEATAPKMPYEPEFPIELAKGNLMNQDPSNIALSVEEAISMASATSSTSGTSIKNNMNSVNINSEVASSAFGEIDQSFSLRLTKEFVHTIAESFGGLPSEEDSTEKNGGKPKGQPYGSCSIRIDMKLAKQIHELWVTAAEKKKEMQKAYREFQQKKMRHAMKMQMNDDQMRTWELDEVKRLQEQYEQDEKLARRLQMAEDRGESEYQKPPLETEVGKKGKKKNGSSNREETPKRQAGNGSFGTPSYSRSDNLCLDESASYTPTSASTSSSNVWQNACKENSSAEPKSLLEIMMDETAAEESEQRQREKKWESSDFATQMKRKELHGMYPGLPAELLDDIFCANNEQLDSTVYAVNCLWLEDSPPPASAMTQVAREKYNNQILEMTKTESLIKDGLVPGISEPMISSNSSAPNVRPIVDISPESSCYEDLRAEANLHKDQMEEAFKKAALAFQQKKRAVSTYYAHQGHLHRMRFKEANKRAAEVIYRQKNIGREERNEIDLHGLHVTEAIAKLSRKLAEKKISSSPHIYIITGRGSNSHRGVAKIKIAATEWLTAHSYEFEEKNAGMLKVDL